MPPPVRIAVVVVLALGLCAPAQAATLFTVPTGPIRPGQSVTFTARGSTCAAPVRCMWTSSDTDAATGATFTRAFSAVGTYTVTLAADPTPASDPRDVRRESATVRVTANRAPSVTLAADPAVPLAGVPLALRATATDPDGDSVAFAWDLDADGTADALGATATIVAPSAGPLTVRVAAIDPFGGSGVAQQTLRVLAAPVAAFTVEPATPTVGAPATLTSTSSDPDGQLADADVTWDLDGDGAYDDATGPTTQAAFTTPGAHVVGLRVRDADGLERSVFRDVVALPDAPPAQGTSASAASPPPATTVRPTRTMSPRPIVRIAGRAGRRGTRFTRFEIRAPAGARARISCAGRGCPWKARTVAPGRVRALEHRLLRPGVRLVVHVTRAGSIGKYTRIVIRRGRAPQRTDRCLRPGGRLPTACPR